jgi:hypothetical protein
MHRLYQALDRIEAQFLRDFLDRHLIEAVVLGDYLSGAVGELPADIYPSVWVVDDRDLDRARGLLRRFLADCDGRGRDGPWTCPQCGETVDGGFDLCWQCGRAREDGFPGA